MVRPMLRFLVNKQGSLRTINASRPKPLSSIQAA